MPGAGLPGAATGGAPLRAGLARGFTSCAGTPGGFARPVGGYGGGGGPFAAKWAPAGPGGGVPIDGAVMTGRVAGWGVTVLGESIDSMPRGEDIGLAICDPGAAGGSWAGEAKAGGATAPGVGCVVLCALGEYCRDISFGIGCAVWTGCCMGAWSGVEGCDEGGFASSAAACVGPREGDAVALDVVATGAGGGGGGIAPFGGPYCMKGRAVPALGGGAGALASFTPNIVTSNT